MSTSPIIPNQFIFVYGLRPEKEPLHLVHYLCLRSCIEVNQPDRVILCSPEEPEGYYWQLLRLEVEWVKVDLVPLVSKMVYADTGINPYRYAHHSDFIRLQQLLALGGVYADLDTLFVNAIPSELFHQPTVLGRERDIADPRTGEAVSSLCNALIMSPPDGAFCRRWYNAMAGAFDGTWSNHSTLLPMRLAKQHPNEIHVEREQTFYYFPPTVAGISQLFDGTVNIPEDTYSIHLWAHLWWSDLRVDFTAFDAGMITEEYVRTVDTTYTLAARPFLPSISPGVSDHEVSPAVLASKIPSPDQTDQQNIFQSICRKLDVKNGFERAILENVLLVDEYHLSERQFRPDDVVVDVGAHLGAFSRLCYEQGCRSVYAYEADPKNFQRLQLHLDQFDGVYLAESAVFRSDVDGDYHLTHSGPTGVNSGGGNVIFSGQQFSALGQEAWLLPDQSISVDTIALDNILRRFERVKILKLDCEGSEFPILLTSQELHRVDEIVGEYHEIGGELISELDPAARVGNLRSYNAGLLAVKLQAAGFEVSIAQVKKHMGYFYAVRK